MGSYEDAEAYLKGLPRVDRPSRTSSAEVAPEGQVVAKHGQPMTVEERALGKVMGKSTERLRDVAAIADAVDHVDFELSRGADGQLRKTAIAVLKDGRRIPKAELGKVLGLRGALMAFLAVFMSAASAGAAALTAARQTECKGTGITKSYLMTASSTIYSGSLVMVDSAGTVVAASAIASNKNVAGVAQETKTSAASGSYWIKVSDGVICKFAGTTLAQTGVGSIVYAEDDQTVDETVGANQPVAGVLVEYVSASVGWVYVSSLVNFGRVNVTQPLTLTADLTLENAEIIDNSTDDNICLVADAGSTSPEDICFDVDGTNVIALSSNTSATELDFGSFTKLTLGNDEYLYNDENGKITLGANSAEDIDFVLSGSNVVSLTSGTGVVEWDFAALGTTIDFANDQTLATGTDNKLTWGDNSEDWTWEFKNNELEMSSSSGVVQMDLGAVGTTVTLANAQYIVSDENDVIKLGDTEDIEFDFSVNNTLTLSSDSGVTKVDFVSMNIETDGTFQVLGSGATIGWEAASAGNTACSTTCAGTGACVIGYDTGTTAFVACSSALADTCVCAGPAS
jgi:hypothetical protein